MGNGTLLHATPMTDDFATLVTLLGREHWRIESITVRLHVLRMAVSGEWPGSIDDADAGLADAVDRLRQEELARAVQTTGCVLRFGLDPETTLNGLLVVAPPEITPQLLAAAEGLTHAIEATREAARDVATQLDSAAYRAPSGGVRSPISPTRAAVLGRLLDRVIPASIEHFLGLRVG